MKSFYKFNLHGNGAFKRCTAMKKLHRGSRPTQDALLSCPAFDGRNIK